MISISLFHNRVDIEKNRFDTYNFHCYKFGLNYLYNYRFTNDWMTALKFLLGYDTKPE